MNEETLFKTMLQPYERHVACFLIAILLGLGVTGMRNREDVSSFPVNRITVVGAVKSIELEMPLGSAVDDVFKKIDLFSDADLSEIDGMRKVRMNEVLVVPFKAKKTFFVCGAVKEPKVICIEGEVTAQKILDRVVVEDAANVKAFLRRRIFPNGSVVEIKKQKSQKKIKN